jgi:hypothetical protein
MLLNLGEWAEQQGDPARARTYAREALTLARDVGSAPFVSGALSVLAVVANTEGDRRRAGTLWGAVEALEARGEAMVDPQDRPRYEQRLLSEPDAAFEAGLAEGRALELDDAVAFGLRD